MTSAPAHKRLYADFVEPNYKRTEAVDVDAERAEFQGFLTACLARIPNEPEAAKNGYAYNAHMGAFVRTLDVAKDHFVKALLAYHAEKKSSDE